MVIETRALVPLAHTRKFYENRGSRACGLVADFDRVGDGTVIFFRQLMIWEFSMAIAGALFCQLVIRFFA